MAANLLIATIPGNPIPAVRMTTRGKFCNPNALRYLAYKEEVGMIVLSMCKKQNWNITDKNLQIYMEIKLKDKRCGDIDNYFKSITDSMQGIVYVNDKQIKKATIYVDPMPSSNPGVYFVLEELK